MSSGCPTACAAACISVIWNGVVALFGLTKKAMVPGCGKSSRTSPRRFGPSSLVNTLTPVALPPGRLKLLTRPSWTGSKPLANTMGIVAVAAFAANAEPWSVTTSIVTCRRTSSVAITGKRSCWPSAKRYSIATLRPAAKPAVSRAFKNGVRNGASVSGERPLKYPMTGIPPGCCARAARGHSIDGAAAAPAISVMNSRRRMGPIRAGQWRGMLTDPPAKVCDRSHVRGRIDRRPAASANSFCRLGFFSLTRRGESANLAKLYRHHCARRLPPRGF